MYREVHTYTPPTVSLTVSRCYKSKVRKQKMNRTEVAPLDEPKTYSLQNFSTHGSHKLRRIKFKDFSRQQIAYQHIFHMWKWQSLLWQKLLSKMGCHQPLSKFSSLRLRFPPLFMLEYQFENNQVNPWRRTVDDSLLILFSSLDDDLFIVDR